MKEIEFYSYMWLREDGSPYYVGKGMKSRAFLRRNHRQYPPKDQSRILVFPQLNEADALESEIELIKLFGRIDNGTGCLRNLTDGGDGSSGYKHTEEAKQRMSELKKGYSPSPEHRAKLSETSKGRPVSEDTRRRRSVAMRGRKMSLESRAKMSAAKTGKKLSLETRAKLSAAHKNKPFSDKHRASLSVAMRGNTNGKGHFGPRPRKLKKEN